MTRSTLYATLCAALTATAFCAVPSSAAPAPGAYLTPDQLPTGKRITVPPLGTQQNVGSEPMNMALTPDGKFAIVSDMGYREYLTCLDTSTGQLAQPITRPSSVQTAGAIPRPPRSSSLLSFGSAFGERDKTLGLYYGLAVAANPPGGDYAYTVYAAQGANNTIAVVGVTSYGSIKQIGSILMPTADFPVGLALDGRGRLYVAVNEGNPTEYNLQAQLTPGSMVVYDTAAAGVISPYPPPRQRRGEDEDDAVGNPGVGAPGAAVGVTPPTTESRAPKPAPELRRLLFTGPQDTYGNYSVVSMNPQRNGAQEPFTPTNYPFAVAALADGSKVYVSSQRDGGIFRIDLANPQAAPKFIHTGNVVRTGVIVSSHPVSLLLDKNQRTLYVANAQDDSVSVISTASDSVTQTFNLRPSSAPTLPGVTPTGLALSADEQTLYATLGDMNAVAVVSLPGGGLSGYVPTGWYPTAVACVGGGPGAASSLLVANAKGTQAVNPNPGHVTDRPSPPYQRYEDTFYDEVIIEGNVSDIPVPRAADLPALTRQVLANNRIGTSFASDPLRAIGLQGQGTAKIQHVIYIIKENRTYDQVLGDEPSGNGDPNLALFGRVVTPNLHALSERFVLLDNFYDCAEVSGDGWNWSTAGTANEYVLRNLPYNYSGRGRAYDFEGSDNNYPTGGFPARSPDGMKYSRLFPKGAPAIPDVATDTNGYIWDQARAAGITMRNYGWFLTSGVRSFLPDNYPASKGLQPAGRYAGGPFQAGQNGVGITDIDFRQFDLDYADSDAPIDPANPDPEPYAKPAYGRFNSPNRFREWNREFQAMLQADPTGASVPNFTMLKLMSDHTAGFKLGNPTPIAHVADNDYGVAEVVQAVSHSPIWNSTAIFVLEDDAQNGPDHVDCHRSTCYVISPWIKKNTVDHNFYNTDSVLHSIELLLGLAPMSQYDAFAPTFAPDFDTAPSNDAPFVATLPDPNLVNQIAGGEVIKADPRLAHLARLSATMDFTQEDRAPAGLLNEVIWKSVKGFDSKMPPPQHGVIPVAKAGTKAPADADGD